MSELIEIFEAIADLAESERDGPIAEAAKAYEMSEARIRAEIAAVLESRYASSPDGVRKAAIRRFAEMSKADFAGIDRKAEAERLGIKKLGDFDEAIKEVRREIKAEKKAEEKSRKPSTANSHLDMPFRRNGDGEIMICIENVTVALSDAEFCDMQIRWDEFYGAIMCAPKGSKDWREFKDTDYTRLQMTIEKRSHCKFNHAMMTEAVPFVADLHTVDSAIEWASALAPWDGVPRVSKFLTEYMGAEDTPYTNAVARYMFTAMAGRVLDPGPGCKADMAPVLVGEQGIRKSAAIEALAPMPDSYGKLKINPNKEDDSVRLMLGKIVLEWEELRGLRTSDSGSIRAFLSRAFDEWVPKFKEFKTRRQRRGIIIGTDNDGELLVDETGNRRFLPLLVTQCDDKRIVLDRDQLWAEGISIYRATGIAWEEAERLAPEVHKEYMVSDVWEVPVQKWLSNPVDTFAQENENEPVHKVAKCSPETGEFLQMGDIFKGALDIDAKNIKREFENRMGKVLSNLGYVRARRSVLGKQMRVWLSPSFVGPVYTKKGGRPERED